MDRDALAKTLEEHWVHSHEEDTPTEMVFRPADYPFPRSRGRAGFQLAAGGKAIDHGIGPTDRPESAECTWRLENSAGPTLVIDTPSGVPTKLPIRSVSADRLVVARTS
jgi:hypothetical protein